MAWEAALGSSRSVAYGMGSGAGLEPMAWEAVLGWSRSVAYGMGGGDRLEPMAWEAVLRWSPTLACRKDTRRLWETPPGGRARAVASGRRRRRGLDARPPGGPAEQGVHRIHTWRGCGARDSNARPSDLSSSGAGIQPTGESWSELLLGSILTAGWTAGRSIPLRPPGVRRRRCARRWRCRRTRRWLGGRRLPGE